MTQSDALSRDLTETDPASALAIDAGLLCIMFATAFLSGSLTLIGVAIYGALLLIRDVLSAVIHRKSLAGSLAHYEFGTGKLEQAGHLAITLVMVAAGLGLASLAIGLTLTGEGLATPRGFALAAAALALLTLRSGLAVLAMLRSPDDRRTPTQRVQLRHSVMSFAALLVVQLTITVAALTNDAVIAVFADFFGAAFFALLMTVTGARSLISALSDLIDHPLDQRVETEIVRRILDAGVEEEELLDLRSRRSGRHIFVELTLEPLKAGSFEEACQRMRRLRRELTAGRDDFDVAVKLRRSEG